MKSFSSKYLYHVCVLYSNEEAARYLETYKAYENKPPDILKERVESDTTARVKMLHHIIITSLMLISQAIECLTSVKKINKSNAAMLIDSFKVLYCQHYCENHFLPLDDGQHCTSQ